MKEPIKVDIDIDAVMNHPRRVERLRGTLEKVHDGISPVDVYKRQLLWWRLPIC